MPLVSGNGCGGGGGGGGGVGGVGVTGVGLIGVGLAMVLRLAWAVTAFTLGNGGVPIVEFWAAWSSLAATLAEMSVATPLLATLVSLGGWLEPPWVSVRPTNWPISFCIVPAAGGPGGVGEAPGRATITEKPGRV